MFQLRMPAPVCWLTMSTVLRELLIITTASTAKARGSRRKSLGGGPQATEQGVLVIRGVASHQQANGLDAAQGNPEKDADANIADQQVLTERNDQPAQDDRHQHQHRAQGEQQAVGSGRNDVLFEQQLQAVREGLKDAQGTGVSGPIRC